MADIRPFCAIRPQASEADKIAALPYDVYNRKEAKEEVRRNPLSFLKIDRPETQFPDDTDMYAPQVYRQAEATLWKMLEDGHFCQDTESCYYIYELSSGEHTQTGLAACAAVDDYLNHVIKRHENTKPEKEEDRIRHVLACQAQTGPIFLAHRPQERLKHILDTKKKGSAPVYDFVSQDGIRHRVWIIYEETIIEKIRQIYADMDSIYIADGHHRAACAVKAALRKRQETVHMTGKEPFNSFLCVLFPSDELQILDYNRVVKDLNGCTPEELLEKAEKYFTVQKAPGQVKPQEKGSFGLYVNGGWYRLRIREACKNTDPVDGLDVSLLQNFLLDPVLGIKKPGEDKRITFVGGIRGLTELEKLADAFGGAAFSLYPTSMEELMRTADAGRLMPPKSTWFEPKLRSGLFIHRI